MTYEKELHLIAAALDGIDARIKQEPGLILVLFPVAQKLEEAVSLLPGGREAYGKRKAYSDWYSQKSK